MKVLSKIYTIEYVQWICDYMQGLWNMMLIVISLGFCGMISGSFAIVLGNKVGKVNEGMCVCWDDNCVVGGVTGSGMRIDGDDFLVINWWHFDNRNGKT